MIDLRILHLSILPHFTWPSCVPVMSALHHLSFIRSARLRTILEFLCQAREIFPSLASLTLSGYSVESIHDGPSESYVRLPLEEKSSVFPYLKHLYFSNAHQQANDILLRLEGDFADKLRTSREVSIKFLADVLRSCVALESLTISMLPYPPFQDYTPVPMPRSEILSSIPPSVTCLNILGREILEGEVILGMDRREFLTSSSRFEYHHPSRQLEFNYYPESDKEPSISILDQIFHLTTDDKGLSYSGFFRKYTSGAEAGNYPLAFEPLEESEDVG